MSAPPDARLLIVDDDPGNRDLLARRLRRLGYACIEMAADGQEALDWNAAQPFDTMLLDVMMPRKSGIEVLETLRAEGRLDDTPVIMISAATELDIVIRCLELGAEDYLAKPFNPTVLRARLGSVLEKRRLRAEIRQQLARIEAELAEARQLQLSMVPTEFPSGADIEVHAAMRPAREVGGDLYDCFAIDARTLCFALGDVSGKGMPAALFMARTRSLLRAMTLQSAAAGGRPPPPSEIAALINEELCKNNPAGMFVTMFVGFLDLTTGQLAFVNAGHVRPLLLHGDGAVTELVSPADLPFGVLPESRYRNGDFGLGRGSGLVVVSDGLPDAMNPAGERYTLERLLAGLEGAERLRAPALIGALFARLDDFCAGMAQADDVTALAVRRPADPPDSTAKR